MRQEILEKIFEKITEYDRIMLFRHIRSDGDCIGASKGLKAILQASFPEKEVYLIDSDQAAYLAFLGPEDPEVPEELYRDALGIVVDTGSPDRISNQKYQLCRELIKIDHHIDREPYGDLSWVEDQKSSACEMIVDFYRAFADRLVLTREAATFLYTGMVTDSGRFRFSEVSGDTMRNAGVLLDQGIDTQWLFANLYLDDFSALKFKAHLYNAMQITENGVAWLFVDKAMQEKFHLTLEEASTAVSAMDSIRGSLCWLAFIEIGDGTIRVRLRSRFMHINTLAEQHHGGGHACASGATVYSTEEMQQMLRQADAMIKEYKQTHEGWL